MEFESALNSLAKLLDERHTVSMRVLNYGLWHMLAYAGCVDTPCAAFNFHWHMFSCLVGTEAKQSTRMLWLRKLMLLVAYARVHN